MKNVELIRKRIVRGQALELQRLRQFISTTEGNLDAMRKMEGEDGQELLAEVTEFILVRLGHVNVVPAGDRASKARRVVARVLAPPKGE